MTAGRTSKGRAPTGPRRARRNGRGLRCLLVPRVQLAQAFDQAGKDSPGGLVREWPRLADQADQRFLLGQRVQLPGAAFTAFQVFQQRFRIGIGELARRQVLVARKVRASGRPGHGSLLGHLVANAPESVTAWRRASTIIPSARLENDAKKVALPSRSPCNSRRSRSRTRNLAA